MKGFIVWYKFLMWSVSMDQVQNGVSMKNKILYMILIFLLGFGLRAQVVTGSENEWIKVNGIGPNLESDGLYWSFMYTTKDSDLSRIVVTDISDDSQFLVLDLNQKQIYEKGLKKSRKLAPTEYPWMYESGMTVRLFEVKLYKGDESTRLIIPLTFQDGVKNTQRMLLKARTGYDAKVKDVAPYNYLDGRKWILRNYSQDGNFQIFEYTLSQDTIQNWKELFTQSVIAGNYDLDKVVESIQSQLSKDCDSLEFDKESIGDGFILYEWNHGGCAGFPPQHEMGNLIADGKRVLNIRYTYNGPTMPEMNYKVWKGILSRK